MAQALTSNCPLRKLRVRDNCVRADGAYRLFKALKKNSRLQLLDVSSNQLGSGSSYSSLTALSEMLRYNRTLRQLNVENCAISRDGCQALARALKSNAVLRSLDLSMNPLRDAGVEALAEGLKYNQTLDVLCLNMCDIANHGFAKLLEALKYNMTLKTLKMCYNKIGRYGNNNGSASPASNSSTVDLNLTSSSISDATLNDSHVLLADVSMSSVASGGAPLNSSSLSCDGGVTSASIEDVYDKLCRVLQQNKDLKVLLWGNKLEDDDDIGGDGDAASELERAIVHSNDCSRSLDNFKVSVSSEQALPLVEVSDLRCAEDDVFDDVIADSLSNQRVTSFSNSQPLVNGTNMSKLNSLQRNFVEQYTIQNGHAHSASRVVVTSTNANHVSHADTSDSQLKVAINGNGSSLNSCRSQVSPRMGTAITTSLPSCHASHSALNNNASKSSELSVASADKAAAAAAALSSSSSNNCNGHVVNNAALHHHPRIRTNGSLPRKPKRLEQENGSGGVSGDYSSPGAVTEDVFRPHTIPRRTGKSTLIN